MKKNVGQRIHEGPGAPNISGTLGSPLRKKEEGQKGLEISKKKERKRYVPYCVKTGEGETRNGPRIAS